jgi:hypothetical protein
MRVSLSPPGGLPGPWRRAVVLLAAGVALILPACGKKGQKAVYPVHGQILLGGRPIPQATVTFHPLNAAATDLRPSAQTDEQGYFDLSSYGKGDGAPEGQYTITVTWLRSGVFRGLAKGETTTYNVLPRRYANPSTSQLAATVNPGTNELAPIQVQVR